MPKYQYLKKSFLILFIFSVELILHSATDIKEITVSETDTLWGIARTYLNDSKKWPEILKYNNISDPSRVIPGTILKIPIEYKEKYKPADIIYVKNDVKVRKKGEIDFNKAGIGMKLYNEDGLRTYNDSLAQLKLGSGDTLRINENSFLILRPEEKVEEARLLKGDLWASKAKVITPTAKIFPKENADYQAKVLEDKTTKVNVFKGSVDVSAMGKLITIPEGFSSDIKLNTTPSMPIPIPQNEIKSHFEMKKNFDKMLTAPLEVKDIKTDIKEIKPKPIDTTRKETTKPPPTDRSPKKSHQPEIIDIPKPTEEGVVPKEVKTKKGDFRMQDVTHYRLTISKDEKFENIVLNEVYNINLKPNRTMIKDKGVPDGKYWMRFAYIDKGGREWSLLIGDMPYVLDTLPPSLELYSPQDNEKVSSNVVSVSGSTDVGARVEAQGRLVMVDSRGRFTTYVNLRRGSNKISVIARDRSNNTTEITLNVFCTEGE